MPSPHALFTAVSASLCLAGCSAFGTLACAAGEQVAVADLVYFGANKQDGEVSPEEWSSFLGNVVTPRFPAGFSVWQASGQWLGANGALTKENTFVLSVVHPQEPSAEVAVRAIISEYKARFRQEAVLRVKSQACMSL